jgi:polyisoprenoid-binding protein YceI
LPDFPCAVAIIWYFELLVKSFLEARMPIKIPTLSPRELAFRLEKSPTMTVVCVLTPETHARKRLPGSICACIYEVVFPQTMRQAVLDKSRPVVVYGAGASREAEVAAGRLSALGYADVAILAGGLDAWEAAGLPLEGEAANEPLVDIAVLPPAPGTYVLDAAQCTLEWTGTNKNNRHHGLVEIRGGRIRLDDTDVLGEIHIDVGSISNLDLTDPELNKTLVTHLLSEDFFATARFPTAVMTITSGQSLPGATPGTANRLVQGTLNLRGVRLPLAFPATVERLDDGRLAAQASFELDRTLWGADYGSGKLYRYLGYHLVHDQVGIAVRLVADPEARP